jgi:hypothetical protein
MSRRPQKIHRHSIARDADQDSSRTASAFGDLVMTHARLLARLILTAALATGAVIPSHAGPADAVTVTDFSSASSLEGWTWTQSTKTLRTISNYSDDWLYQESYFNLADITGGQSVSITGNLLLDYNGDGDFVLELIKSGTLVATGAFSFFDFAGGPKTVTSPLTFNDPSVRTINAWVIWGNGNPWEYECEITFTDMFVSVPEPSSCFSLAAALALGGWHVLKSNRKRMTSAACDSAAWRGRRVSCRSPADRTCH